MARAVVKGAPDDAPPGFIAATTSMIAIHGYDVEYVEVVHASKLCFGAIVEESEVVEVQKGLNSGTTARTLVHELAHVIMHLKERTPFGIAEVEAEMVALGVCTACGMSKVGYHPFPSMEQWAPDDFPATVAVINSMVARTHRTTQYILTGLPHFGFHGGHVPVPGVVFEPPPTLPAPEAGPDVEVA